MKNKLLTLSQSIKKINSSMEYDIKPLQNMLAEINRIRFDDFSSEALKLKSLELKHKALQGVPLDSIMTEAYALVREVSKRVLKMNPFDGQIMTAVALHQREVVEMQTGEGKTLAAVMPAYLNALTGKGVHVLTFNDYLAARDAKLMDPIYEFLGMTTAYVIEGMSIQERRKAYQADITYVTAKEAGFDYLRDFLCTDIEEMVHRELNFAIIDEADSILIDEARIPLVIAGNIGENVKQYTDLSYFVRSLTPGQDYEVDEYGTSVYFTDLGLCNVEAALRCGNIFDSHNLELLARLNCALYAEVLLKRDKDYIVRDGKVEIVDEFTGRIADKRHWPDNLHAAVEAKEGISSGSKGKILGSIALQHFISLYAGISGMTGTAETAARELKEFYNLGVVVIPTNKPCIRKDHEDEVFIDKAAKHKAIVYEVIKAHEKQQPVLIGTCSVEESEQLAELLKAEGISCNVLNAKNDAKEAEIIARAGELGAVTVSTNMAGRGVDIKLGGTHESLHDKVAALGGLYVIGTNRHESRRIDNQLKGRAGRQGDPGESRFFISLEDEWIKKYDILRVLHVDFSNIRPEALQSSPEIRRVIEGGQRIVEGYSSDLRSQQWKYSFILEQQRRIIHRRRQELLAGSAIPRLLVQKSVEKYASLQELYGIKLLQQVEIQLTLYYINKHWADYLDYISYIRESIHLVVIGGQNPLYEYNKRAVEAFEEMLGNIEQDILKTFEAASVTERGIDIERLGLKAPSSTWTYLINESPDQFSNLPFLVKTLSNAIKGPLFTIRSLYDGLKKRMRMMIE